MPEYLIAFNDEWVPHHTPEQLQAKAIASRAVVAEMQDAGVLIYTHGALDAGTAIGHVTAVDGAPVFGEGTFTTTEQHLGGFAVVDVPDDDTARYWAGRIAVAVDWPQEVHRFPGAGHRAR